MSAPPIGRCTSAGCSGWPVGWAASASDRPGVSAIFSAAWRSGRSTPQPRSRYLAEALPLVPDALHEVQEAPEENPLAVSARRSSWPPDAGPAENQRDRAEELVAAAGPRAAEALAGEGPLAEQTRRVLADLEARSASIDVRSPARLSASDLVARAQDADSAPLDLLRPLPRRPSPSARRGTRFHAWLEERFGATGMLDIDSAEDAADLWVDEALDLGPMQEWFRSSRWAERGTSAPWPGSSPAFSHSRSHFGTSFARPAAVGGSRRYSTTRGSMPACRISASALRDVPQAGLW